MSNISKEILRNYVDEQNFKNPNDVLAASKFSHPSFTKTPGGEHILRFTSLSALKALIVSIPFKDSTKYKNA